MLVVCSGKVAKKWNAIDSWGDLHEAGVSKLNEVLIPGVKREQCQRGNSIFMFIAM